jgi:hypothetical protein
MANRHWFDELRERLSAHALPRSYVQRFVQELTDHVEFSLVEAFCTMPILAKHSAPASRADHDDPTSTVCPTGGGSNGS